MDVRGLQYCAALTGYVIYTSTDRRQTDKGGHAFSLDTQWNWTCMLRRSLSMNKHVAHKPRCRAPDPPSATLLAELECVAELTPQQVRTLCSTAPTIATTSTSGSRSTIAVLVLS